MKINVDAYDMAVLAADALLNAKIIDKDDLGRAIEIIQDEIEARTLGV